MIEETRELITSIRKNELEFPSEVSVTFANVDNDYQVGNEYARRLTARHENKVVINLPLALTSQEAAKIADIALNSAWYTGRYSYTFSSNYSQLRLSPGDLVTIPLNTGGTEVVKIISVDYGPTGLINYEAVPELPSLYNSVVGGNNSVYAGQSLTTSGPTTLFMLDCPLLRDTDNSLGWYIGMSGYSLNWRGGVLYKSTDSGATYLSAMVMSKTTATNFGTTTTLLASGDTACFDTVNKVTISMVRGSLGSATLASLMNGSNSLLIGAHGRWELVQFRDVIDNGNGSYTIYNLLRGRKGTEWAMALHTSSDTVVVLDTNINTIPAASTELLSALAYKAVTAGEALETTTATNYTYTGERLECYSPIGLRAYKASNGDIYITWTRRDRIYAGWNNYSDIPQSEAIEKFKIEFFTSAPTITNTAPTNQTSFYISNSTALSNLVSGSSNFTINSGVNAGSYTYNYTSAAQTTDGGAKTTIYVRIYQVSSITGQGHYAQATLVAL